jgi:hypothetical protein
MMIQHSKSRTPSRARRGAGRTLAAALLACALAPAAVAAQHAVPLDPQHPRAVRAGAVVERLLAGDRAGAEAYLRQNGDSAYVASGRLEPELDALASLSEGGFRIDAFVRAGPDIAHIFGADAVLVVLVPSTTMQAVSVRVATEAPFRILGVAPARPGGG